MAAHAIGDIEALLDATGISDGDDADGFEEQIRKLVLDSLAGINVEAAMKLAEDSIAKAKATLIEEEQRINTLLGGMGDARDLGPRAPDLPPQERSLDAEAVVLQGLESLGAQLHSLGPKRYASRAGGQVEVVELDEDQDSGAGVSYLLGRPAFDRLVARLTQGGQHDVVDVSGDSLATAEALTRAWVESFSGTWTSMRVAEATQNFKGTALVQVRATVAHDSYERLLTVKCSPKTHTISISPRDEEPALAVIDEPQTIGVNAAQIAQSVRKDPAIAEFCRFYLERKAEEVAVSDVTGAVVNLGSLKTSRISGRRAEARLFGRCTFTDIDALETELAISEISQKKYRRDEQLRSEISGLTGHKSEFTRCVETNAVLLTSEAKRCAITQKLVAPGVLETRSVTNQDVLPGQLEESAVSRRKALKRYFVTSSVSGARLLEEEAVRSATSAFCLPAEAKPCFWGGSSWHPDDLRTCKLTGMPIHVSFASPDGARLNVLNELLGNRRAGAVAKELWPAIEKVGATKLGGTWRIEATNMSPDGRHLAVCAEMKSWLGLRTHHVGLLYSVDSEGVIGTLAKGKRRAQEWVAENH